MYEYQQVSMRMTKMLYETIIGYESHQVRISMTRMYKKTLTNMKANQKPKKTCFLAGYKENQRQTTKNLFCSMQFNKLEKSFWGFSSYNDSLRTCRSLHQLAHSS